MPPVPWKIRSSCLVAYLPLQHLFSHHKVSHFTFNLNFGINKWSFKLIKNVMAVFPLFAPFRIYKNIHTQNFTDKLFMLKARVLSSVEISLLRCFQKWQLERDSMSEFPVLVEKTAGYMKIVSSMRVIL